jgi:hypothetical protein
MFQVSASSSLLDSFDEPEPSVAQTPESVRWALTSEKRLHTIPAFISIIGGLVLFGAPGFILGPLTATMTMLLVELWMRHEAPSGTPD